MHTQSNQKSRIIDIALQAGVSTATVDRVLNGRGGVRGSTEQKVQAAIRTLQGALSRPQIIPSVASNGEIDVVMAGGSGFANENRCPGIIENRPRPERTAALDLSTQA